MPQDQDDIKGADAMKQAPTPGPVTADDVKLLVKGDLLEIAPGRIGAGKIVVFDKRDGGLVIEEGDDESYYPDCYIFHSRPFRLAPTAPVEASGSERWTDQDIEDLIADSISDSIDMDWSPRVGAMVVFAALRKEGLLVATKPLEQPGLTPDEQKTQASRCSCRGADDMCPCQNAPDRQTIKDRPNA